MHFLALLALTSAIAPAARAANCPLPGQVSSCSENSLYTASAQTCLKNFANAIEQKKQSLASTMANANAKATSAQSAKEVNHSANLQQTLAALDDLIRKGEGSMGEVALYIGRMTYPGKLSGSELEQLGFGDLMNLFPCWADNRAALADAVGSFYKKVTELQATRATTQALQSRTDTSAQRLGGGSEQPMEILRAPANLPAASENIPQGTSPQPASDITGTQQQESKDRAVDEILNGLDHSKIPFQN